MKKITFLGLTFAIMLSPLTSYAVDLKIGYVDVASVFRDYNKSKDYDKFVKEKTKQEEDKLKKKGKEIVQMRDKIALLKEDEQEKQGKKLSEAVEKYRKEERKVVAELRQEEIEKMREIAEDIDKVIKDYAARNKFDLVLDGRFVLHSSRSLIDISDAILKRLNEQYKKK